MLLLLLLLSGAQALAELLESDDKFGFIVMDGADPRYFRKLESVLSPI